MKRTFALLFFGVVAALGLMAYQASQPIFDEVMDSAPPSALTLAPQEDALTFVRTTSGETFLVTELSADQVMGVSLTKALSMPVTDAVQAINSVGYAALSQLDKADVRSINLEELALPFVPNYPHIAAGTNYKAHAEEAGLEDGPFLFPKISRATPWNADVPLRNRLDYEAEICVVPLAAYSLDEPSSLGYVLCNDYTDRLRLVQDIDLDLPNGRTGFADAKGGEGMLSIGPFLVVPREGYRFFQDLQIGLAVNDQLRQRSPAALMIWSPDEIIVRALQDCEIDFISREGVLKLTPCDAVAPGTLILTGTPSGVLFDLASIWSPWAYLREGDRVLTFATHLGMLQNQVVKP